MNFPELLKEQRESRSWSPSELARILGVSSRTINNWEAGKDSPNIYQLIQISNLFNVSLDELIKDDPNLQHQLGAQGSHDPHNAWEFFSRYWWLAFAFLGWLSWLILMLVRG